MPFVNRSMSANTSIPPTLARLLVAGLIVCGRHTAYSISVSACTVPYHKPNIDLLPVYINADPILAQYADGFEGYIYSCTLCRNYDTTTDVVNSFGRHYVKRNKKGQAH
jgi:hypothetical protein